MYYCSELIYEIFLKANQNVPVFTLNAMTFKAPGSKDFTPEWVEYYKKLGEPIPEGEPGINIRPLGECKYEKRIILHETIKYMERHLTTLELSYKYTDVTSNPDYPITYEVKGSMTMERQINPLIPDEDQAIEW